MIIEFTLNGELRSVDADPLARLLDVIREEGLVGTKEGCGSGDCGACTILLEGEPVNACLLLAPEVEGRSVETIEGLVDHPIQRSFRERGAIQCRHERQSPGGPESPSDPGRGGPGHVGQPVPVHRLQEDPGRCGPLE